jgi:hypothetical protein
MQCFLAMRDGVKMRERQKLVERETTINSNSKQ